VTAHPAPTASSGDEAFARVRKLVSRHIPPLDGLRGVAIVLVAIHNIAAPVQHEAPNVLLRAIFYAHAAGWVGVQLFFVLSGFLITGILVDTKGAPSFYRSFYLRRGLRIFPLYYIVLFVWLVLAPLIVRLPDWIVVEQHRWRLFYWFYVSNWIEAWDLHVTGFGHFWSLAVEEQFYLFWPLVVVALSRRTLARTCVTLAVVAFFVRVAIPLVGLPAYASYTFTFARMDALVLGAFAALIVRDADWLARAKRYLPRARVLLPLAVALVALPSKGFGRDRYLTQTIGYALLSLWSTELVLSSVLQEADGAPARLRRFLSQKPLRILGKYSYAIYVLHVPIGLPLSHFVSPYVDAGPTWRRVAVLVGFELAVMLASFVAALLTWNLIEKHFLRLKDVLAPKPKGAPVNPPP